MHLNINEEPNRCHLLSKPCPINNMKGATFIFPCKGRDCSVYQACIQGKWKETNWNYEYDECYASNEVSRYRHDERPYD